MILKIKNNIRRINLDKSFSEILTGSVFALAARVGSAVFALVISLLVARVYGAKATGVLAIVQSFMVMISIFSVLGTNVSILRLIPEHLAKYSVTSAFRVYRKTQYLVSVTALVVGSIFFIGSGFVAKKIFFKPELSYCIGIAAICVLFRALMDLNTQAVRGLRLIRTFALMQVLPHFLMLAILCVAVLVSGFENDPVYAQLTAWGGTAVVGVLVMDRTFRRRMQNIDLIRNVRFLELLSISTPMMMTALMNFVAGQVGVLILGGYRSAEEVGYYSVAVKFATLTTFILQSVNSMAAPKFSEFFHTGKLDELFRVAKKSTRLIFWTTVPILILIVVFGNELLKMYGKEFTLAYVPMLVLLAGQFVNSVSGSTGIFMNMTGHQKQLRNIVTLSSLINVVLCFVFIPLFGALGASIAGSLGLLIWNGSILFYIKNKYGKTIGYFPIVF